MRVLSRLWWALPLGLQARLDSFWSYVWFDWQLVKSAAARTARIVADVKTDLSLVALGAVIAAVRAGGVADLALSDAAWAAATIVALLALAFLWNLVLAAPRMYFAIVKKDEDLVRELRDEVRILRGERDFEKRIKTGRLNAARLQIGTELRDIRHKIEIVRSTRPHPHYSREFRLPGARWHEFANLLAEHEPALYTVVGRAYTAAHHVNEALEMRRSRSKEGQILGVIPDDGLDAAYDAAGEALDALGEERGTVWETAAARDVRAVTEDIIREAEDSAET